MAYTTYISLRAIGPVPRDLLISLVRPLAARFGRPIRVVEPLPFPADLTPLNGQYPSRPFLWLLAQARQPEEEAVVGLVDADLTAPGLNFIFGEADRRSGVAVVALARLRQGADPATFQRRVLIETVHELGHLAGLGHCTTPGCVMRFSNTLADVDEKTPDFCPRCEAQIARPTSPV